MRRLAGFAESAVLAADGIVGEEARLAFEKILKLEPGRPEPRFWLALAKEQDGKLADALADYKGLLSEAPAGSPVAGGRGRPHRRGLPAPCRRRQGRRRAAPGPLPQTWRPPRSSSPEARARMIAQMVDGLAERLKRDGRDLAGWLRLVNAYAVLDRGQDARTALAEARKNFPADEKALAELAALAKSLGLGS